MATFLLAWIINCAGTGDPPAPRAEPPGGIVTAGAGIVTVGVADEVFVVAVLVTRGVTGAGASPWGLNVPVKECWPSEASSPFTLTSVRLWDPPKGRMMFPALDNWISGESIWKVEDWFHPLLMSNQIWPSNVFKFTVVGVVDPPPPPEPEEDEAPEKTEPKPTVAVISPLTLITANWSLTIMDRSTTLAGPFEFDVYEIESALMLRDWTTMLRFETPRNL